MYEYKWSHRAACLDNTVGRLTQGSRTYLPRLSRGIFIFDEMEMRDGRSIEDVGYRDGLCNRVRYR